MQQLPINHIASHHWRIYCFDSRHPPLTSPSLPASPPASLLTLLSTTIISDPEQRMHRFFVASSWMLYNLPCVCMCVASTAAIYLFLSSFFPTSISMMEDVVSGSGISGGGGDAIIFQMPGWPFSLQSSFSLIRQNGQRQRLMRRK
jgi:hypothetical protein